MLLHEAPKPRIFYIGYNREILVVKDEHLLRQKPVMPPQHLQGQVMMFPWPGILEKPVGSE